jgi:hypothetical protein
MTIRSSSPGVEAVRAPPSEQQRRSTALPPTPVAPMDCLRGQVDLTKGRDMKIFKPLAIAAIVLSGSLGLASPASADPTVTTFTLTGGALTLNVSGTATLTGEATGVAANTISGQLGTVTVTDDRGGVTGWVTSAISGMFTRTVAGGATSTDVLYSNGTITVTGTSTVTGVSGGTLVGALPVATATAVSGNNTASWNPTIDVLMPAGALVGTYTATVTTSIV